MTFWRLEPLDELVHFARRCASVLEGLVPPPAQCILKVYPLEQQGRRTYEVQLGLDCISANGAQLCHRGADLFETVEQAFTLLAGRLCPDPSTSNPSAALAG